MTRDSFDVDVSENGAGGFAAVGAFQAVDFFKSTFVFFTEKSIELCGLLSPEPLHEFFVLFYAAVG